MTHLVGQFDWGATPLGDPGTWPPSLAFAVDLILGSAQAMQLAWGPRRCLIYNDAYAPMLGNRHPDALGQPFDEVWSDVWPEVAPLVHRVFQGETVHLEDMKLTMTRYGYPEETWWTFSYSPVRDEAGNVLGLLNVPIETTARVRAERAERALRSNEQRLVSVLDGMDQAFGLMDREFRILTQNRAALQMDGRPLSEIVGRTYWEVYPGSEDSPLGRTYKRVLAENVPVSLEHRFRWLNGTETWLEMHAAPVPEGLAVFWRDITQRKASEAALRESEGRHSFLVLLGDALRPLNDGAKLRARGSELLASRLEVDHVFFVEFDPVYEAGVFTGAYWARDLPELVGSHLTTATEAVNLLKTGKLWIVPDITRDADLAQDERDLYIAQQFVAWIYVPLLKAGRLDSVLAVLHSQPREWPTHEVRLVEETAERLWASIRRNRAEKALRESELRFQQFGSSSHAAIWIRDSTTFDFEYANAAVERVFGLAPSRLFADEHALGALIVPADRDEVSQRVRRIAAGETMVTEYRIRHAANRTVRWIRSIGFPINDAQGQVTRIGGIAEDVTETKLAREHQQLLLSELQHRVRNLMTVIRTIAVRTEQSATTPREYRDALTGRLTALARVQTLLTRAPRQGGSLREVILAEIQAKSDGSAFQLNGSDIQLSAKAVEVVALAIHELCTNAVKYGALSVPGGRITVDWRTIDRDGSQWLVLDWIETGRAAAPPTRRGFGTELIEERVPYELGGIGKLTYGPTGAACHMEFPLQQRGSFLEAGAPKSTVVDGEALGMTPDEAELEDRTILVVEDDFYIATDLASSLHEVGATVLGPCFTEADALLALDRTRPNAAVLDVNLGESGPSFRVATRLRELGIPFLFLTGYDRETIPPELRDAPHLEKPADFRQLLRHLARLCGTASAG